MDPEHSNGEGSDKKPTSKGLTVGAATAIGAGVGGALTVATDSAVWIAVGVAIGAGVGTAMQARSK